MMRRLSQVIASIVPATLLVFQPKCPLCIAAWPRGGILLLWVAIVAPMLWRRAFKRAPTLDAPARRTGLAHNG
jgi:hypothetical protein